MSGSSSSLSNGPSKSKKQSIKTNTICPVCGDNASIINYGALSCLSCRTFFRRNGYPNKSIISCRYDGHCEVNILTRKICAGCRLAKCHATGMSSDLIRKEDLAGKKRKSFNSKIEELTLTTISQQSALDPPDGSCHLSLSTSERTLISNVVHAFDKFNPASEIRRIIENLNISTSNCQFDASQTLQLMSAFYNSLQLFISSTPDFQVLTPNEQCSLFHRNMLGLLGIGGMYLMRESGIFDRPENEIMILPLYETEVTQQFKVIGLQLNGDPILFKLMLVALAFSSNCYMIDNRGRIDQDCLLLGTFRLLGSQNVYVELMWKYLMNNYTYFDSVHRISTLIKQFLYTVKLSTDMYENNAIHRAFIDDRVEQNEASSFINESAIVPLWGKKH